MLRSWLCCPPRWMMTRRGATMLEYVMLIILMGTTVSWFMRAYTPPIIRSLLVAFSTNFARFPN